MDLIGGCGLRAGHAVQPWLPTDRDRVVLFFTFIPQFCAHPDPHPCRGRGQDEKDPLNLLRMCNGSADFSERPPTTITSATMRIDCRYSSNVCMTSAFTVACVT